MTMTMREKMARAMRPDFYDEHSWKIVGLEDERTKLLKGINAALDALMDSTAEMDRAGNAADREADAQLVWEAMILAAKEGK